MDLEVVGRHALLFDDDAMAAFVNSNDALVEWNSLRIDRYDVRHLLSSPPKRRRDCSSKSAILDDSYLESQLNHERYLDLPLHPDQPEEKHKAGSPGYHNVALSYGGTDGNADKKNEADMKFSRFLPRFPIPNDLQSLPPTEKVHQIIARTALFVSKHGGQSEIILRVKQGNNPTFGFLMPGHHLHTYFRYLVEHIELLHSESDKKFQDEQKKFSTDHSQSNVIDGALTLLGSVYGSGDEDEDGDNVKRERVVSHDDTYSLKTEAIATKTEPMSKQTNFPNRENVLTVKKNSSINTSKSGTGNSVGEKPFSSAGAVDKAKNLTMAMTSKIEPVIFEPPTELKKLINKLVELILRNGKQFEEALIEQEMQHGRFPFLIPSDQYHSYYLKVLQTSQEAYLNYKTKKNYEGQEKDFSSVASGIPMEFDRKEKFTMVIGKSKKETQEAESNAAQQEWGIDASSAAAILQAATRGIDNSNPHTSSITSSNAHVLNNKSDKSNVSSNTVGVGVDPETLLTKEQKLKAERLRRAKKFVAMLRSGQVSITTAGVSRGSSVEPLSRSAGEDSLNYKKTEGNLALAHVDAPATGEKRERNYFGERNERPLNRKYRSKSDLCNDDDDDDDSRKSNGSHSKGNGTRSKSGRYGERNKTLDMVGKHHHRRHRSRSLSNGIEDEESSEEDRDCKHRKSRQYEDRHEEDKNCVRHSRKKDNHKRRHRTHSHNSDESEDKEERSEEHSKHSKLKRGSSSQLEDESEGKYGEDENHIHTSKRHHKHHSSREHSQKKRLSKQSEDEKHRSRDSHKHKRSRKDKNTQSKHKHEEASSSDEHHNRSERNDLEEGEISYRVCEKHEGISNGRVMNPEKACTDVLNREQKSPSEPLDTTAEVPGDLRAKIRAMLMSTRA